MPKTSVRPQGERYRLGCEVSEVLNRVRAAFGPLPMKDAAERSEIRAAEKDVESAAAQILSGAERGVWHRALAAYEAAWIAALKALRNADKRAA